MMNHRLILRRLFVASFGPVIGIGVGCGGQTEIPLAKVPPPPPDFGKPVASPKTPPGGSPETPPNFSGGGSK